MKTKTVLSRFRLFRIFQASENKWIISSRASDKRCIELINQGGNAIALPIVIEADGNERVVFSKPTIKELLAFLTVKETK